MRSASPVDVGVVIVSYNTRDVTLRCINSLKTHSRERSFEIVVIDNASVDGSADAIEAAHPDVILVRNGTNRGFGPAQNQGLSIASGRYMLVLNSDMVIEADVIAGLLDVLEKLPPSAAAVGPEIRSEDGLVLASARRATLSTPLVVAQLLNMHFQVKRWLPSDHFLRKWFGHVLAPIHDTYRKRRELQQVEVADGMCILLKRDALREVGLFDEQYFFDAEIVDLANRLRARGWSIYFTPTVTAVHLGHISRRKNPRILRETNKSTMIYHAKYSHRFGVILAANRFFVGLKLGLLTLASLFASGESEDVQLYREIWADVRRFTRQAATLNERIPRLPS